MRASNNKLIDRAIRYSQMLLKQKGISANYETICKTLFECQQTLAEDEAIVLKVVERMHN